MSNNQQSPSENTGPGGGPPRPENTAPGQGVNQPAPDLTPSPDPGYPDQMAMNQNNPDRHQNEGERPRVQQEQDESTRKAELRKAVEADMPDPNNAEGNENTQYSGNP
jgi:hypothetical protein